MPWRRLENLREIQIVRDGRMKRVREAFVERKRDLKS